MTKDSDNQTENKGAIEESRVEQQALPKKNSQQKPAKHRRRTVVIWIVIAVALAVSAGVWFLLGTAQQSKPSDERTSSIKIYEETLAVATRDLSGVPLAIASTSFLGGQTDAGYVVYEYPAYTSGDSSFKNLPREGKGYSVASDKAGSEANVKKISDHLKTAGYTKMSSDANDAHSLALNQKAVVVSYEIYASKDTVCSVSHIDGSQMATVAESVQIAHVVGMGCAALSDYSTVAGQVQDFYNAYSKANAARGDVVLGVPDKQDGANGQQYAVIYQKDSATQATTSAHFYYTEAKDAGWTYLAAAPKGILDCSQIATPAQKAAFKGSKCYGPQDSIIVVE